MTFHDLKWPWRLDEGSPVTIFRLRVSILPVTRCFRVFWMVFMQKRRLSFSSHWLIMERSQNWPDLRSPISKFRDMRFIDTGTDINRWTFQGDRSFGVAMTNIQTCLTLSDLGPKFSQSMQKRCMNSCTKNGGAPRGRFPAICEKPEWGCSNTPSRPGAG